MIRMPDGQLWFNLNEPIPKAVVLQPNSAQAILDAIIKINFLKTINIRNEMSQVPALSPILVMPYAIGARADKPDQYLARCYSELFNQAGAIVLFDVHSEEALNAYKANLQKIYHISLADFFADKNQIFENIDYLLCPDFGAYQRVSELANRVHLPVFYCEKERDQNDGQILRTILPDLPKGNALIVDDICDGGATFINIGKLLPPGEHKLLVSHGIFSKGFDELNKYFTEIYTTNSFRDVPELGRNCFDFFEEWEHHVNSGF